MDALLDDDAARADEDDEDDRDRHPAGRQARGHVVRRRDPRAEGRASAARRSAISARSIRSPAACCRSASGRRRRSRATCCSSARRTAARSGSGVETDTLDRTGRVTATAAVPDLLAASGWRAWRGRFSGTQQQVPPMFSALKRDGVPLYKLARRGIEVERAAARDRDRTPRSRRRADRTASTSRVECSKGTYVRVLAADLGRALGTVAHLERCGAPRSARSHVEDARTPERPGGAWPSCRSSPIARGAGRAAQLPLDAGGAVHSCAVASRQPLRRLAAPPAGEAALVVDDAGRPRRWSRSGRAAGGSRACSRVSAWLGWLRRMSATALSPLQGGGPVLDAAC